MSDVDGHGEDDGGVVLGSYGVQCLQVSQLKHKSSSQMAQTPVMVSLDLKGWCHEK
jgi:hypothetical protein